MGTKTMTLRGFFKRLPPDGVARHEFRNFNLGMSSGAARLGFDVYLVDLPKSVRGRLVQDSFSENGHRIDVNKDDDVETRRWSVLHEVMHFFLHPRHDLLASPQFRAGRTHFYDADEERQEREANAGVEALIFGDGALNAAIALHGDNEPLLARRFGVSLQTLRQAKRNL
jgi:Zn-dependent peptidase ImmA (M78 family)